MKSCDTYAKPFLLSTYALRGQGVIEGSRGHQGVKGSSRGRQWVGDVSGSSRGQRWVKGSAAERFAAVRGVIKWSSSGHQAVVDIETFTSI